MANQLEGLIENCNELQDQINKATEEKNFDSALLREIDDWQRQTIEKVNNVAELARQHVVELLNSQKVDVKSQFKSFFQELIQLKETGDFLEHDLEHLEQTVAGLNLELKQLSEPPEIDVCLEYDHPIQWDDLIYIIEQPPSDRKQRRLDAVDGELITRVFSFVLFANIVVCFTFQMLYWT